jgi:tRNA modification GTPase
VESIGIERSLREIDAAGLILAVFDGTRELDDEDRALISRISESGRAAIALVNKSDVGACKELAELERSFSHIIKISASTGDGFEDFERVLEELFIDGEIDIENDAVVTGARQYSALMSSADILNRVISDIASGMSLDACCVDVECAMAALGEVDGREIGEEIVAEIFSRFCVGK